MQYKQNIRPMRAALRSERGVAIVFSFMLLILMLGVVTIMHMAAWNEDQLVEREENLTKALYGAEAGVAIVENMVWNDYIDAVGTPGIIGPYQAWLTANTVFNDGATTAAPQPAWLPAGQLDGMTQIAGVQVTRADSIASTLLDVNSLGQDRFGNPRRVIAHLEIKARQDRDFNFSMMARNMECIFCHTEIDSAARVNNTNPRRYGFFERVRVAAIGEMINRDPTFVGATQAFDTRIAGTLYTQGNITNKATGTGMTSGEVNASDLDGYQFDPITNYIAQNGAGATTTVNLDQANTVAGVLESGANLYLDYPTLPADQTDGPIDGQLPVAFTDVDGDLVVSAADVANRWARVAAETGLRAPGSVSGGIIRNTAIGGNYNFGALPGAGNIASIDAAATGVHTGHVIMVGTPGNPLMLDKTIVIDGDLIIEGTVQGEGQIYVSGNVYVVGDILYNDGPQWGMTALAEPNMLMIRAGGNVLVNDYLTPQLTYDPADPTGPTLAVALGQAAIVDPTVVDTGDHQVNAANWSYAMEQLTYYNRAEWQPTQIELQKNNGNPGTGPGTTNNGTYDAAYRPVYVRMGANDPVYVYALQDNSPIGAGRYGTYWVNVTSQWRGDVRPTGYNMIHEDVHVDQATGQLEVGGWSANGVIDTEDTNGNGMLNPGEDANGNGVLDIEDYNGSGGAPEEGPILMMDAVDVASQNGAIIQLGPNNAWISDQNLKSIWIADDAARTSGDPITINAGLHADQVLLAASRNNTRYNRNAFGQLTVNGLLVSKNLGILATADLAAGVNVGLRMNYDTRLGAFNEGVVTDPVAITRLATDFLLQ